MTEFQKKVYNIVKKIPEGKVMTYKEEASAMGNPQAFRAVGNALNKNPFKDVPCHRVIRSDGNTGGYAFGAEAKRKILKKEGWLTE